MDIESKRIKIFINKIKSWKFSFFLISKLPLAYFAGLKIKEIDSQKSIVTAPVFFQIRDKGKGTRDTGQGTRDKVQGTRDKGICKANNHHVSYMLIYMFVSLRITKAYH